MAKEEILSPDLGSVAPALADDRVTAPAPDAATGRRWLRDSGSGVAPVIFVVLLLVVATAFQGAFELRTWGPLAIFVLAVLAITAFAGGGVRIGSRGLFVALAALWGLAVFAALSMTWAQSADDAWVGAGRLAMYAGLATIPPVALVSPRALRLAGGGAIVGVAVIAVVTLVRLLAQGGTLFLAGRLDDPVGYRNATACLFTIAFWPLVAYMASRGRSRLLRGSAFSLAVLCLGLAYLTQSRGAVLGLVVGGIVAIVLGPARVRRVWVALLAVAGVAAASSGLLVAYHAYDGGHGIVQSTDVQQSAQALLALTAGAFIVGFALALFDEGLRPASAEMNATRRIARLGIVALVIVGLGAGVAAVGDPVQFARDKWHEFARDQTVTPASTRLATVSGQRHDLWRVALTEFSNDPVHGVGESNYSFGYYRYRHTNRNLDNPHSLIFGLLSELGIVGLGLFALFVAAIVATVLRGWRRLPRRDAVVASGLIAAGATLFGQLAVDWIDLIPGVTGLGVFALMTGVTMVTRARTWDVGVERSTSLRPWWRVAAGVPLVAGAVAVGALYLSDAYVRDARAEIGRSPAALASAARSAGGFDPLSVTPHYLQAGALETVGRRAAAKAQLDDALRLEPENVATLGLLGDFEARAGRFHAARRWYAAALRLDPLDAGLRELARTGGAPPGAATAPRRHRRAG